MTGVSLFSYILRSGWGTPEPLEVGGPRVRADASLYSLFTRHVTQCLRDPWRLWARPPRGTPEPLGCLVWSEGQRREMQLASRLPIGPSSKPNRETQDKKI